MWSKVLVFHTTLVDSVFALLRHITSVKASEVATAIEQALSDAGSHDAPMPVQRQAPMLGAIICSA